MALLELSQLKRPDLSRRDGIMSARDVISSEVGALCVSRVVITPIMQLVNSLLSHLFVDIVGHEPRDLGIYR